MLFLTAAPLLSSSLQGAYQAGHGATPAATIGETLLCFATTVFRPMAAVNTSIASKTDASLRDISCLPRNGETPGALYIKLL